MPSDAPTPRTDAFLRDPTEPETDTRIPGELEWRIFARRLERRCAELEAGLRAAGHALRSYQYGNSATDLAQGMADKIDALLGDKHGS